MSDDNRITLSFYGPGQGNVDLSIAVARQLTLADQVELSTTILKRVCGMFLPDEVGTIFVGGCDHAPGTTIADTLRWPDDDAPPLPTSWPRPCNHEAPSAWRMHAPLASGVLAEWCAICGAVRVGGDDGLWILPKRARRS